MRGVYQGRAAYDSPPVPNAADIALLALLVPAVACTAYWAAATLRIADSLRRLPTCRAGAALPEPSGGWPAVCVIVPAHNEGAQIAGLVASLRAQRYPRLSIVLALDRCTDDTEARARAAAEGDDRIEIIGIDRCPPEWAGKVHAVWSAVSRSPRAREAELLLFADADTEFDPDCVRAAVALLGARGLDMLSLLSTLTSDRWFERAAQTAFSLELLRQYPLLSANRWPEPRPFANGQFMLFRRAAYERIGGHEAVRTALLEDIALARAVALAGLRPGVLLAGGMLRCRMYDDWTGFRRGWKRIFIESTGRRSSRLLSLARRQAVSNFALPLASLACFGVSAWTSLHPDPPFRLLDAAGLLISGWALKSYLGAMLLALRAGRQPLWTAALQPIGGLLCAVVLRESALDLRRGKATAWGGRAYVLEDRDITQTSMWAPAPSIAEVPSPDAAPLPKP